VAARQAPCLALGLLFRDGGLDAGEKRVRDTLVVLDFNGHRFFLARHAEDGKELECAVTFDEMRPFGV